MTYEYGSLGKKGDMTGVKPEDDFWIFSHVGLGLMMPRNIINFKFQSACTMYTNFDTKINHFYLERFEKKLKIYTKKEKSGIKGMSAFEPKIMFPGFF